MTTDNTNNDNNWTIEYVEKLMELMQKHHVSKLALHALQLEIASFTPDEAMSDEELAKAFKQVEADISAHTISDEQVEAWRQGGGVV